MSATLEAFIDPAVAAVNTWEFKPATRAGKPVEVAANIALRFRLEGDKHGDIPSPMLGDLAIFPADAAGKGHGAGRLSDPPRRRSGGCASRPCSTWRRTRSPAL